jgi:predicted O-methyltransferase YrrM
MDLVAPAVTQHLERLVGDRDPVFLEMEARAAESGFPIIGPAAGQYCYLMARLIGARSIYELGSGYGYSTAWFARAVDENGGGRVDHVVWDEKLSADARGYLDRLGYGEIVRFTVGEAVAALRSASGPYDLIFNDIDKAAYPESLSVIAEKLRPGGLLITDNVLWSGRIFDETDTSAATEAIRELTRIVTTSPDWIASIVPIRDGLLVACRR